MTLNDLSTDVADPAAFNRAVGHLREARVALPRFDQLADPRRIPARVRAALAGVDPDAAHPLNLFRVHWWNDASRRGFAPVPEHVVLPESFTGVPSPIVVALGDRFPMIRAHKVLAAYACLAPRLVCGRFDPSAQRAIWPSTGNYCRGGLAIARIMGCRGVAVLPEGMSEERFRWLERWALDPADIVRTPGSESNIKEIYDRCADLERDPENVVFNQFSEYGNHLAHLACTGSALSAVFEHVREGLPGLRLAAFVSATGSAGTIGAGDALKERFGSKTVAVEPVECPTMLENGFGEHNIQGIGDKHVPLIHNVMNTDVVVGVSDRATDRLAVMFASAPGREYLVGRRGVPARVVESLDSFGLSSICNVLAAVKTSKQLGLGPRDAVITVATDGAGMYASEHRRLLLRDFSGHFGAGEAAATFTRWMLDADTTYTHELTETDRRRIFNLGYFTWVEQRGVPVDAFTRRRAQSWWTDLRDALPRWDAMIEEFNRRTGALEAE
jgi:cysteine synthase